MIDIYVEISSVVGDAGVVGRDHAPCRLAALNEVVHSCHVPARNVVITSC